MVMLTMQKMLERVDERLKIEFKRERALELYDLIKNKNEDNEWRVREEVFSILEGLFFEEIAVKYLSDNKHSDDVVTTDITCFIKCEDSVRIILIRSSYSSDTDEITIDGCMVGSSKAIEMNNCTIDTSISFESYSLEEEEDGDEIYEY